MKKLLLAAVAILLASPAYAQTTTLFSNSTTGNVGIGTTAPANSLDVSTGGGIHITSGIPSSTSMALYNNAGALMWNGTVLGTASSVSGTTNYIPVFTASNTLGNSIIYQSGSSIGIGTTSPGAGLDIGSAGTTLGTLRLEGNTSGYVQLQPAAGAGSWTMTLPSSAGTNGYVLQTNGAGVTSWVAQSGGGGGVTGSGATNYTARWTSSSSLGTGVLYDNGTSVAIGTTNPLSAKLYITSGSSTDTVVSLRNTTIGNVGFDWIVNDLGKMYLSKQGGGEGGATITLDASGRMGIDTPYPSVPLDVAGTIRASQAFLNSSSAPTISSCGASPPSATSGSNNNSGQFTLGTGSPTACTVTFANAYPTNAFCTVTPATNYLGTYYISAQSASAFTVALGTGTSSAKFNYTCGGN